MSRDEEKATRYFVPSKPTELVAEMMECEVDPLIRLGEMVECLREVDDKLSLHGVVVLIELGRNQALSQTELGELTRIRQSNLSRLLSHLGKGKPDQRGLGLVSAKVDEYNQRSKRFYLTKKGELIIERWRELLTKQEK